MKILAKCTLITMVFFTTYLTTQAQTSVKPFSHLGVGVELGTTGVGLEVATPLHSMVSLRAGFSLLPFKYSTDFDLDIDTYDLHNLYNQNQQILNNVGITQNDIDNIGQSVDLDAKSGLYNGKLLVDFYPARSSSFHITAGLYFGRDRIVTVEGSLPGETFNTLNKVNQAIKTYNLDYPTFETGIVIGDYTIEADENGIVDAGIKIQKVKPYVGIGFGRAIPKRRVGVMFDLGCMFHGKPSIVSKNAGVTDLVNQELDSNGIVDIMNKITVYPVLSIKLTGRIF